MNKMSVRYRGAMDWMANKDWYVIDEKRKRFILTEKAPEHARESFELYKKVNKLYWFDPPVHVK